MRGTSFYLLWQIVIAKTSVKFLYQRLLEMDVFDESGICRDQYAWVRTQNPHTILTMFPVLLQAYLNSMQ